VKQSAEGLREVLLSAIDESPLNPRRLFNPEALEELATSIRKKGIIQPLVVRKVAGRYELIAGARRLRAATLAKLAKVPIVVRQASDEEVLELMLIENLQRAELNAVDECEGYWELVEKRHYTATRIAEQIGKSISYVSNRMLLRQLVPEAKAALATGRITPSHAIELARADEKQQRKVLKIRSENKGPAQMTVHDVKTALRPTETRKNNIGAVYDVVSRCWRCNTQLEYDTDSIGRTLVGCRPCLKFIRDLEDKVRRLEREARERVAA
jgi:ParB/RepB/Spo0J family partition protein